MNSVAFLKGYLHKESSMGSTASFSSAVGNATKNFMRNGSGSSNPTSAQAMNLPVSKFTPKLETDIDRLQKAELRHPVTGDVDTLKEVIKEEAG